MVTYNELMDAGLGNNEAKVYLALLRLRSADPTQLIKESGLHRPNVYNALSKLIEKGLVSTEQTFAKKRYIASDPRQLLYMIKSKEEQVVRMIPSLMSLYSSDAEHAKEVIHFKGPEGVMNAYYLMIDQRQPFFAMCVSGKNRKFLKHRHYIWDKERIARGIIVKAIYFESSRKEKRNFGEKLMELRYLPEKYRNDATVDICGELVLILLATDEISGILIRSPEIAEAFRQYFKIMWTLAKK
jgi:sugar-specific transcriptional regulator TrmB